MNIKNMQVAVMKILHSFIGVLSLGVNVPFFARLGIVVQFLVKPTITSTNWSFKYIYVSSGYTKG